MVVVIILEGYCEFKLVLGDVWWKQRLFEEKDWTGPMFGRRIVGHNLGRQILFCMISGVLIIVNGNFMEQFHGTFTQWYEWPRSKLGFGGSAFFWSLRIIKITVQIQKILW